MHVHTHITVLHIHVQYMVVYMHTVISTALTDYLCTHDMIGIIDILHCF